MKLLTILASLTLLFVKQTSAYQTEVYSLAFQPNANITRFESTLIIPPSTNENPVTAVQNLWPALARQDDSALFYNFVTNLGGTGTWYMVPPYCCNPNENLASQATVYGNQALTSIFAEDVTNGLWIDSWVVESGIAPNVQSFAGSVLFNPATTQKNTSPFDIAILAVELQLAGTFSFGGPVVYQNVIIVAETTSTAWCTSPNTNQGNPTSYTMTSPIVTVDGPYTTCYVAKVTINGPK